MMKRTPGRESSPGRARNASATPSEIVTSTIELSISLQLYTGMPPADLRPRVQFAPDPAAQGDPMGFDQYHEPPGELPARTRTFARLCASLTEEAEAIGWYEQRIAIETDPEALAVMRNAQLEEFKHFSMDLEFLLRRTPLWRGVAPGGLFAAGGIVGGGGGGGGRAGGGGG